MLSVLAGLTSLQHIDLKVFVQFRVSAACVVSLSNRTRDDDENRQVVN